MEDIGRDGTMGTFNSAMIVNTMDDYCNNLKRPTVVVLDNTSIHTSKDVNEKRKEWEDKGLSLHFIPPYSPQLNLIEIL